MSGTFLFVVSILTLAGITAIFSMILNFEAGWAGLWDLGLSALLAVGAYTFVVTTQTTNTEVIFAPHLPLWMGIILAGLAGGLAAFLLGIPALRMRGIQFLIATLAFGEVVKQLAINWDPITNATVGFNQFSRPFGSIVKGTDYNLLLLGLIWVVVAAMYFFMRRLAKTPFIRVLRGYRDNDPLALSLGKQTQRYRRQAYIIAGTLYGLTVPLYVWYVDTLNPKIFTNDSSFLTWAVLIVGGIASKSGPLIGAVIMIGIIEATGLIQGSSEVAALLAASRWMMLGLVLILVMRFRPEGIFTEERAFRNASALCEGGEVEPSVRAASGSEAS